jgi:hypothetical protein
LIAHTDQNLVEIAIAIIILGNARIELKLNKLAMKENKMRKFPFDQAADTKDCGYRCSYYVIQPKDDYEKWLENFRFFSPIKSGIYFTDICSILSYFKFNYKFTQLSDKGLYIVYSGIWLHPEGKKHGHYFVYHDETVYCSTHSKPYKMSLSEAVERLESKTVDHAFRCLKIID